MELVTVLLLLTIFNHAQGSKLICAYKYSSVEHTPMHGASDDEDYGGPVVQSVVGNDTEQCTKASNFCYTLWEVEENGNSTTNIIMGQGCWESSDRHSCERPTCVADHKPSKARNTTRFCCCSGELCNHNVSDGYVPPAMVDDPRVDPPYYLEQSPTTIGTIIIVVLCFVALLAMTLVFFTVYRKWCAVDAGLGKSAPDAVHLMESCGPGVGILSGNYTMEHLKLSGIVAGQGRYGCVWKGSLMEQEVAVKIFPAHHRNYFYNERDIYCLPFMESPALLTYFGCDERTGLEGNPEYMLVLSYATNGCLQDYLHSHTLDWKTFCRMAQGVAKGLAHLHTDIRKGDKLKPCVSHRDLNTRNILVTAELGCVLCDLGFAMKLQGSKYFCNGEEQHAETKSINDVGTLRYMAPEVLEGAVNLRDCESSLKQIDVYALGLVLWELATRCSDLYQPGTEMPSYRLPFEAEVGHHPSFEQMQVQVSRHKARPLFPDGWRDWTAVRLLRETVEDCWDQDADARLTALCVEERLQELPSLWDRQRATIYVSGVSPTVNPTFPAATHCQVSAAVRSTNNNNNNNHNNNNNNNNAGAVIVGSGMTQDTARLLLLDPGEDTGCSARSVSQSSATFGKETRESTVSEGTVETMVTMSPSEPHADTTYKNSNHSVIPNGGGYGILISTAAACPRGPLQPFQGRNPCLERNLMLAPTSEDELSCNGNTLVDRSFKHAFESQALVSHDFLAAAVGATNNGPRPATPIPYVQNAVYDMYSTVPKQPNIPGNGNCLETVGKTSRWGSWNGLKKLLDSKKKQLFGTKERGSENTAIVGKECSNVDHDDAKSNLLARQNSGMGLSAPAVTKKSPVIMETQVCLLPSGKLGNGAISSKKGVVTSVVSPSSRHSATDQLLLLSAPDVKPKKAAESEGSKKADGEAAVKHRRPSTLPLVSVKPSSTLSDVDAARQSLEEQFQRVFGSGRIDASRLKDPNSRVKTPGDVPPSVRRNRSRGSKNSTARFSLYDDRMMSSDDGGYAKTSTVACTVDEGEGQTLSCSVPSDMDISCSSVDASGRRKRASILKNSSKELRRSETNASSF